MPLEPATPVGPPLRLQGSSARRRRSRCQGPPVQWTPEVSAKITIPWLSVGRCPHANSPLRAVVCSRVSYAYIYAAVSLVSLVLAMNHPSLEAHALATDTRSQATPPPTLGQGHSSSSRLSRITGSTAPQKEKGRGKDRETEVEDADEVGTPTTATVGTGNGTGSSVDVARSTTAPASLPLHTAASSSAIDPVSQVRTTSSDIWLVVQGEADNVFHSKYSCERAPNHRSHNA